MITGAISTDFSYRFTYEGFWSIAEIGTGILCSCLPTIPKFAQTLGPKLKSALSFARTKPDCSMQNPLGGLKPNWPLDNRSGQSKDQPQFLNFYGSRSLLKGEYNPLDDREIAVGELHYDHFRPLPVALGKSATDIESG
jgi:hypothetical protein